MRKIFLFLFLFSCSAAFAQNAAISRSCDLGATPAKVSGMNSTNLLQGIIPLCTVSVYLTGTTTLATIYSDGNNTVLSNPFTASPQGVYTFYAATGQGYDIVQSGGIPPNNYSTPVTITNVFPCSTGGDQCQVQVGPAGPGNSLSIGTVTTGPAAATITGTSPDQILNLTLPQGPPANFRGNWSITTTYQIGDGVYFGGSSFVATAPNVGIPPPSTCTANSVWIIQACEGSPLPVSSNVGQAPTSTAANSTAYIADNPTARNVLPDVLATPATAYTDQTTPISAVTDTNAKTALTVINNSLLSLQSGLENNGIVIPTSLQAAIAGCATCGVFAFNPTGAATGPASVTNIIASGTSATFTQTPTGTGSPNFNPGFAGPGQWGSVQVSSIGNGNMVAVPGYNYPGAFTASRGQTVITSSSQVVGGGTLTGFVYPVYNASSASLGSITNGVAGTISAVCQPAYSWTSGGSLNNTPFSFCMRKSNEWEVGDGVCAVFNTATSAFVTYTFPNSIIPNGTGAGLINLSHNITTLVEHGNGTFHCYLNDGSSTYISPLQTALTTTAGTVAPTTNAGGSGFNIQSVAILPTIQLTQPQIAGLACGFTSTGTCVGNWGINFNNWTTNAYTSLSSQPAINWFTHAFSAGDPILQDCAYFNNYGNGSVSGSGQYFGTYSNCHAQVSTNAPSIRVALTPGICATSGCFAEGVSAHVDGVLADSASFQSSTFPSYLTVSLPNDGNFHTVDFNMGESTGNVAAGYSHAQLYSGLTGQFLREISIPNNQKYTMSAIARSSNPGTTTICFTDSILCTGHETLPYSSMAAFVPMWRNNGTSLTPDIAALGAGSFSMFTDFNTDTSPGVLTNATGGGSLPDATATSYINTYVASLDAGNPFSISNAIIARGVNAFAHGGSVYGSTANCLGIEAYAYLNALKGLKVFNSTISIQMFSILNAESYAESATDGCSGDSWTTTTALTAYLFTGGVWTSTNIAAGTVFTGAQKLSTWRIMQHDICLTSGLCGYFETGPGAPGAVTGGVTYYPPDLSGLLATATVTTGGSGYTTGDTWCPTQATGYGGCYSVTAASGAITALAVLRSGRGYTTATGLSGTTSGSGSGAVVSIVASTTSLYFNDSLHLLNLGAFELCQYYSVQVIGATMTCKQFN